MQSVAISSAKMEDEPPILKNLENVVWRKEEQNPLFAKSVLEGGGRREKTRVDKLDRIGRGCALIALLVTSWAYHDEGRSTTPGG